MTDLPTLSGPHREARSGKRDNLVILLHGYGADGNDLIGLAGPLSSVLPDTEFVAPNAHEPCRAAPFGRQWHSISRLDGSSEEEMMEGFHRAKAIIDAYVDAQIARTGLPASKVALVGFSQGTMMSLAVGPRREQQLAGIVGFSGLLREPEALASEIRSKPPVLLIHGEEDPMVPFGEMAAAESALHGMGVSVDTLERPELGHSIDEQGLVAAAEFLIEQFGAAD